MISMYERLEGDGAPNGNRDDDDDSMIDPTDHTHNIGSRPTEYEEFFSGTVPCPSCRGLGRIPKELEQQMVAIIPLNDKRLKPSKAYIYVIVAVLVCVLIGGALLFFLLPRAINIDSNKKLIIPRAAIVTTNKTNPHVFLDIMVEYNITNNNYFPVSIDKLEVFTQFDSKIVGRASNQTVINVAMRKQLTYSVNINITFDGDEGYIAYYCSQSSSGHNLLLPFSAVATFSYMGHTEESNIVAYNHVKCNARELRAILITPPPVGR